jgi:hypothetical protein
MVIYYIDFTALLPLIFAAYSAYCGTRTISRQSEKLPSGPRYSTEYFVQSLDRDNLHKC